MSTTEQTAPPRQQIRQTGSRLSDALMHVTALFRGELDLLRAEVDQNVNKATTAIGLLVAAVVFLLVALNVLAGGLVALITKLGIPAGYSAVIVGVVLALIGAITAKKGTNDLKATSLAPTRTAENVQRDSETVKKAV